MSHLWGFDRGFTSWAFFGLLLAAVIARWYLRGHSSYWIAAAVLAVLHVPIVVYYPWHGSGQGFIPFAILDFAIDFGSLGLVGKVLLRRERRSGAP